MFFGGRLSVGGLAPDKDCIGFVGERGDVGRYTRCGDPFLGPATMNPRCTTEAPGTEDAAEAVWLGLGDTFLGWAV